jgi:hypothetical protein
MRNWMKTEMLTHSGRKLRKIYKHQLKKFLSFEEQKKRLSWFDDECEEKITIRKVGENKMLETTCRTLEEYRTARNEAMNMCHRKHKLFQENILQDLQDKFGRNETRKYYESVHNIKHDFQLRTNLCQDVLGSLVAGDAEVLNRYKE